MATEFDFIQSYKDLDASAPREVIDARFKGFQKLTSAVDSMTKVYDLCKLAFQMEHNSAIAWFEEPIKKIDPHFSLKSEKADAGRMAALLLQQQITKPQFNVPLAVLATSYCGRRRSADGDVVTNKANEAFKAAIAIQKIAKGASLPAAPKLKPSKAEIDALNSASPLPGATAKAAIDSVLAATETAVSTVVESIKGPISQDRKDIVRLAEEVDMLWWYVGEWLELIDKPRTDPPIGFRMVVSGIELGAMVRQLPGPFGAIGLLRKLSAAEPEEKATLHQALANVSLADVAKLARSISDESMPLVPVHAAIQLAAQQGSNWEQTFEKFIPGILNLTLSPYEIGVQAFRERALLGHGGVS